MVRRPLSEAKKSEIVRLRFVNNLPYEKIREITGVSIGKISQVIREFEKMAKETSLEKAAESFSVADEISSILSLSDDLDRANIAVSEAKEGFELLKRLREIGVKPEEIERWISLCKQLAENRPAEKLVPAAMRVMDLELKFGKSVEDLLADYERKVEEKERVERELKELVKKKEVAEKSLKTISSQCEKKKRELGKLDADIIAGTRQLEATGEDVKMMGKILEVLRKDVAEMERQKRMAESSLEKVRKELKDYDELKKKIAEELEPKRRELEQLEKKEKMLTSEIPQLEKKKGELVESIAKYEIDYGNWVSTVNKVVAKIEGMDMTWGELQKAIADTLKREVEKEANNLLAQWIRMGYVVLANDMKITVTCPECGAECTFDFTPDFMKRMMRGEGEFRLPLLNLDLPRFPPSPGSTTVKCPSCSYPIEITSEYIVKELSRISKAAQRLKM